jgi:ubiquinone biosynthesis monooxygenase Coq7
MLKKPELHKIIRVDHAGEYGARVIYDGQIAAFKLKGDKENLALVREMKTHEDEHFEYFDQKIIDEKVRPTLMQPLWKVGGFAMGFFTAMLDKKAAMACTTAVEEVIDEHYQSQIVQIDEILQENGVFGKNSAKNNENCQNLNEKTQKIKDLREKIEKFRQDELHHRDIGYENDAAKLPYFKPLSSAIKCAVKFAIGVSKRV